MFSRFFYGLLSVPVSPVNPASTDCSVSPVSPISYVSPVSPVSPSIGICNPFLTRPRVPVFFFTLFDIIFRVYTKKPAKVTAFSYGVTSVIIFIFTDF